MDSQDWSSDAVNQLSDYFRPPSHDAVRLIQADEDGTQETLRPAHSEGGDLLGFVDALNSSVLSRQEAIFPMPAFHMAFIRGGVVQNRLQVSKFWWNSAREIFGLDSLAEDLEGRYGKRAVAETMREIRRRGTDALLRHRGPLGPAKLLTRLRRPDDELWSCADYAQIEKLMDALAILGRDCDELTRSILAEPASRVSLDASRAHLARWLCRCRLEAHVLSVLNHFDLLLDCQESERCLHPCLPFEPAALERTAIVLGVSGRIAKQVVCLIRFSWLTSLASSADVSDLSFKSLCVYGRAASGTRAVYPIRPHETLFEELQDVVALDSATQAFRRRWPDVPIEMTLLSLCLPAPVYALFAAERSIEARLRFLPLADLGGAYFKEFAQGRACHIPGVPAQRSRWLDDVTSIRIKSTAIVGGSVDHRTLSSRNQSSAKVKRMLKKAIESESDRDLEKCQALFRRVGRDDLVGNLRGEWKITTG